VGKGRIVKGYRTESSFRALGIEEDLMATFTNGDRADSLVWTHRAGNGFDIYFVSNQSAIERKLALSLRVEGKAPELWDPVTGAIAMATTWKTEKGRTIVPVRLDGSGSLFVVLQQPTITTHCDKGKNWVETKAIQTITHPWTVQFDPRNGGPAKPVVFDTLTDWRYHPDSALRYYAGKAAYETTFNWSKTFSQDKPVLINLGKVANTAEVLVNGISCGIAWTVPYQIDISKALKKGRNNLRIEVINTWNNRLVGDSRLPPEKRITHTIYPFKMEGKPLLEGGLLGPVTIEVAR
jgi:hypothetical protein